MSPDLIPSVAQLIRRLDTETAKGACAAVCDGVKDALIDMVVEGGLELPPEFTATSAAGYARRLLHAGERYAIVVMVWDRGQGTPIHDHDDKWCVECVYQGRIAVDSYDLQGSADAETVQFVKASSVTAGRGEAGSLIPPFDYHVIENAGEDVAVTIHVYGGEMFSCDIFEPLDGGGYRRVRKPLSYTA